MIAMVMQAPWKAVGDHFKSGGSSREVLYLTLTVLALIGLLVIVHRTQAWASERSPVNNPQRLFRDVLAKLGLAVKQRDLLRRVARDERVEHPVTLVLCPNVFRGHFVHWLTDRERDDAAAAAGRALEVDALCHALFDEPLREDDWR